LSAPPNEEITMPPAMSDEQLQSAKTLTTVVYALYAAALIIGISAVVAIVINYVKRDDMVGTWLESHFRWQIRTFWFGLLWFSLGVLTYIIIIGWVIMGVTCVWFIYRIVKGWLYLNDNKPMYPPAVSGVALPPA
jgi:uncharacterized membrane protein